MGIICKAAVRLLGCGFNVTVFVELTLALAKNRKRITDFYFIVFFKFWSLFRVICFFPRIKCMEPSSVDSSRDEYYDRFV